MRNKKGQFVKGHKPTNGFIKGHKRKVGKKLSEEVKNHLSKINTGKKITLKIREKMSKIAKEKGFGKWMIGKKASLETRKKLSENQKGNKCHFWRGGVTAINKIIRMSLEYRLWREAVFKRDNYTCVWCGARNGNGKRIELHPDHIKSFALFPELRFAIDNGRTLCIDCHKKTDTYAGKTTHN